MEKYVKDFVENQKKHFPNAATDVLEFIANIVYMGSKHDCEVIESLFGAGYCYYFALILKDAFGGKMMWSVGRSHIVWLDTRAGEDNAIPYDVHGVYYDYDDLWPVERLMSDLEGFRHRGHDYDIEFEIQKYREEHNMDEKQLNEDVFKLVPIYDRSCYYPNLNDTCRYWDKYRESIC